MNPEPHPLLDTARELQFHNHGVTLHGLEWGEPTALPVIALHGWLDNAASFAPLAQHLSGLRLIAIDLAGHGLSDHRSLDNTYNIWQDVADLAAVVDQLGLESFALLGHSRGAMVATLGAGTFPSRVAHLGLLDSFVPQAVSSAEVPAQLALSIVDKHRRLAREPKIYESRERALASRTRGETPLGPEAAELIAARGLHSYRGGYRWRADEKLKIASEVKLTPEIVAAFVERVRCPSLLLLSDRARMVRFYGMEAHLPNLQIEELGGGHHFHMGQHVESVARRLEAFYRSLQP